MISLFSDFNGAQNSYPALVLKKTVVFPTEKISLVLEGEGVSQTITEAHNSDHLVILCFQKNGDRSGIGVIARIMQHWNLTDIPDEVLREINFKFVSRVNEALRTALI